jgi:hypothetical protein
LRPIKTLPEVEQGVAAFENSIEEFAQAGGVAPDDKEMKDDLLRILPEKMQLDLLWHATKEDIGFAEFRDHIVSQSALVMNVTKPHNRGIHQVAGESPPIPAKMPADIEAEDMAFFEGITDAEGLIAAFQKYNAYKKNGTGSAPRSPQQRNDQRPPRPQRQQYGDSKKCANCGGDHDKSACSKPVLAYGDRLCWTCGQKGCNAKTCPNKPKGPIKAIEDGLVTAPVDAITQAVANGVFNGFFHVDDFACKTLRRSHRSAIGVRRFGPSRRFCCCFYYCCFCFCCFYFCCFYCFCCFYSS